jgi:hypothetical protein
VSTASTHSFSHPKKYAKSHVKSQTEATTPNFISENKFSILQTEHNAHTPTTSEFSTTRQGKKKFPPSVITSKINYFNVLKDLEQVITTDINNLQQRIRFHFSSEQDYKVGLNYFKFNKIECYTYQTTKKYGAQGSP